MPSTSVIVIGAGAGGMMVAGRAAECGARVTLLEKTDGPGKKTLISGQTRCNVTNARPLEEFVEMYGKNGRFLYPAFRRFFRDDLVDFLGRYGVPTTTERDGRVFPASGKAQDVVEIAIDIALMINKFKNLPNSISTETADIYPCVPNGIINALDIAVEVQAYKGYPYYCSPPCH